ncbi:MAG: DUF4890 domain-containing protein [Bacteroidaceae bacterium]|nr:DUF4890 domain-containing protein [Bacteroidaceae bacterium]
MRKLALTLLFTFTLCFTVESRAQETESAQTVTLTKDQEKEIEELTKSMIKTYGLNAEQATALRSLNEVRVQQLAAIDAAVPSGANAAQKTEVKKMKSEIQKEYDATIKDLFSEKQYQKYLEEEAKKKEQIKGDVNWLANFATRRLGADNVNLMGWNGNVEDSLKIAQEATDKLVKKYKLNDEQKEKLLALNIAEVSAELAERRSVNLQDATATERAEQGEEFLQLAKRRSANYDRYLKEILTEEQYKKYSNTKKAQQSRSQRWGGGWGGSRMW